MLGTNKNCPSPKTIGIIPSNLAPINLVVEENEHVETWTDEYDESVMCFYLYLCKYAKKA